MRMSIKFRSPEGQSSSSCFKNEVVRSTFNHHSDIVSNMDAAHSPQKSALNVVMVDLLRHFALFFLLTADKQGAMTFGEAGKEGARVHELKDVVSILEEFQSHGFNEVIYVSVLLMVDKSSLAFSQIDTARVYCGGTSEEYLGKVNAEERGLLLETKLYPSIVSHFLRTPSVPITQTDKLVRFIPLLAKWEWSL